MATPPIISTQELRELLANQARNNSFLIVDVRSESEVRVSVIPSAIPQAEFERTVADHRGKEIIAYCTVGARSGKFTKKLSRQGWRVRNYEGSIIDWCKHKLPLMTLDGAETQRVHTYSARYSVPDEYEAIF